MEYVIEVKDLIKRYGSMTAVDEVGFSVRGGALFAFLGPNGAGKTTLINVVCTTLKMDGGSAKIYGYEVGREDDEVRRSIGVVFQNSMLDKLLTVRENISTRASFYGLSGKKLKDKIDYLSDVIGIDEILDRPYGKLSGGQRRRADIARALVNTPKVLFLDEPTTGLDPQTRVKVWNTINQLRKDGGMTVFLTTHYMEEAATATDIAIIDRGKIVARGTPDKLKEEYSSDLLRLFTDKPDAVKEKLCSMNLACSRHEEALELPVRSSLHALEILKAIEGLISGFEVAKGNMDNVFLNITGRTIRDEEGE